MQTYKNQFDSTKTISKCRNPNFSNLSQPTKLVVYLLVEVLFLQPVDPIYYFKNTV